MTVKQRLEGGKGVSPADILRKNVLSQGDSPSKGLKAEIFLVGLWNTLKASVNRTARASEDEGRGEK